VRRAPAGSAALIERKAGEDRDEDGDPDLVHEGPPLSLASLLDVSSTRRTRLPPEHA